MRKTAAAVSIAAAAAAAVASGHANRFVPSLSFSSLRIYLYQPSSLSLALYERACEGQGTWGFSFPLSSRARARALCFILRPSFDDTRGPRHIAFASFSLSICVYTHTHIYMFPHGFSRVAVKRFVVSKENKKYI